MYHNKSCTALNHDIGVMYLMALSYAVNKVNKKDMLYGNYFKFQPLRLCGSSKIVPPYITVTNNGFAAIGPYSSEIADFTTQFLSLFHITTISYGASSSRLSDRKTYERFFRTVPTDDHAARIFASLAKKYNWVYIAVIYTDNDDGRSMKTEFEKLLTQDFCIRVSEIVKDEENPDHFRLALRTVFEFPKIRVIYLFLTMSSCRSFLIAAETFKSRLRNVRFILSSSCGTMLRISPSLKSYMNGLITIGIVNPIPEDFAQHFETLVPSDIKGPVMRYLRLYYRDVYGCGKNQTAEETLLCYEQPNTRYNRLAPVLPVINAVYALAQSLRRVLHYKCAHTNISHCYTQHTIEEKKELGSMISTFMPRLSDNNSAVPKFCNHDGAVVSDFNIYQYQQTNITYNFMKVGYWNVTAFKKGKLGLGVTPGFHMGSSRCSTPCGTHETVQMLDACHGICWKCRACDTPNVIVNNTCFKCAKGFKANPERTGCHQLPVLSVSPAEQMSLVIMSISGIFIVMSLFFFVVYIKNYNAPIIKATSRELSLFSLGGLFLMLFVPIIMVQRPCIIVCSLKKLLSGLSLTCAYAPLMLKTNRIYRIFISSQKFKLKKLTLVTIKSQFLLIAGMVGVQVVIGVFWIVSDKPSTVTLYPRHEEYATLQCFTSIPAGVLNFLFPLSLMILATFWAFKTRNLPESYSEIKSIGATMYITLFALSTALAVTAFLDEKYLHVDTYIICFGGQFIAIVTLIGQYAMKVKTLYYSNSTPEEEEPTPLPRRGAISLSTQKSQNALSLEEELDKFAASVRKSTVISNKSQRRVKRFSDM